MEALKHANATDEKSMLKRNMEKLPIQFHKSIFHKP